MSLIPLSRRKDEDFPHGSLDVRGWKVMTSLDDERVGRVEDILLDAHGRPCYLDVDVRGARRHVLVPLSRTHADAQDETVWVDGMSRNSLDDVPAYALEPENLTPDYERRVIASYDRRQQGTMTQRETELPGEAIYTRLGDMEDHRVSSADSDPRGWDVVAGDGRRIGEVSELIVDRESMRARYLDCDVEEDDLEIESVDRHVLIPVERARLDGKGKKVVVDGLMSSDIAAYPVYSGLPLTRDTEQRIHDAWGSARLHDDDSATERRAERRRDDEGATDGVTVERTSSGDTVVRSDDREVRIRLSGDDIVIEKRPRT